MDATRCAPPPCLYRDYTYFCWDPDLNGCGQLSDITQLSSALRHLPELKHLKIDFSYCRHVSTQHVAAFAASLGTLTKLRHLHSVFSYNRTLADISSLGPHKSPIRVRVRVLSSLGPHKSPSPDDEPNLNVSLSLNAKIKPHVAPEMTSMINPKLQPNPST